MFSKMYEKEMTLIFQNLKEKSMGNALESAVVSMTVGAPVQAGPSASGRVCLVVFAGGRAVGSTRAGSATVGEQSVFISLSDLPTSPSEHNHTVMSEPLFFAVATSHDSSVTDSDRDLHSVCVCVSCLAVSAWSRIS